ncbi:hypothetical protein [Muricomes intestini]|jgi:hypothetical protein|uniref:Uncharacterized protein n=1 Tax=Muricomes intestini TaxID=1796634 RepID=A0A4R3JZR6_9FIRM|nr:hypothetical protein [Muricomes intestini]TCS74703.1 hypothetical protein EDD59_13517 [Muricomes intestini]
MALPAKEQKVFYQKKEAELLRKLDKGIDDMEQGRILPLRDSMDRIKEKLKKHEV